MRHRVRHLCHIGQLCHLAATRSGPFVPSSTELSCYDQSSKHQPRCSPGPSCAHQGPGPIQLNNFHGLVRMCLRRPAVLLLTSLYRPSYFVQSIHPGVARAIAQTPSGPARHSPGRCSLHQSPGLNGQEESQGFERALPHLPAFYSDPCPENSLGPLSEDSCIY